MVVVAVEEGVAVRAGAEAIDAGISTGSPWPNWPGGPRRVIAPEYLARPVPVVARDLLGAVIETTIGGQRTAGVIVETEAYLGPEDPASHAATRGGVTPRNRPMFGPPGHAYIYRSYGMHWCLKLVAEVEGVAGAVLIRGVDPIEGVEVMERRRGGRLPIAAGPGRLAQALGITDALNEHALDREPLRLLHGWPIDDREVRCTPRIGITRAIDAPLRYFICGRPGVTPGARSAPSPS